MKKLLKFILYLVLLVLLAWTLKGLFNTAVKIIYPLKYQDYIMEYSKKNDLDPYFVMALIKAESNFNPSAHSGIARGLMQITDETGGWIAGKLGKDNDDFDIEDPETNIEMGCYYLRYLEDIYHDKTLVLASYNAGMGNVSKWLSDPRYTTDKKTLTDIPFKETKTYVKKVFKYENVYRKLYDSREVE